MIVQFTPIRSVTSKGGALVWRLLVERSVNDGAATVTVSASPETTTLKRAWTTQRYNDVDSPLRTSGEFTGTVADTLTFGDDGGIAVYEITDSYSRTRTPEVVQVNALVNGVVYTATGRTTGDVFTRGGALDGELVIQKLLQAANTDDEEYLEDMINLGWNFSKWLRWTEQLDAYVQALRIPLSDTLGSRFVTLETVTGVTTGDGKVYFTVPPQMNSLTLRSVYGALSEPSSSGAVIVQLANVTGAYDHLSSRLTIDVDELTSATSIAPVVIDTSGARNMVTAGELLRVDVDSAGVDAQNLQITLGFS